MIMDSDILIRIAGALAILAAVGHGYMGDKILAKQNIEPEHLKSFIRWCYQFGSVAWFAGGILFLLLPTFFDDLTRQVVIYTIMPIYLFACLTNAWFTKLRHMGWVILLGVVVLAVLSTVF